MHMHGEITFTYLHAHMYAHTHTQTHTQENYEGNLNLKRNHWRTGEIAQWLRALVSLTEGWVQFLVHSYGSSQAFVTTVSEYLTVSSNLFQIPGIHAYGIHKYIQANTPTHRQTLIDLNIFFKKSLRKRVDFHVQWQTTLKVGETGLPSTFADDTIYLQLEKLLTLQDHRWTILGNACWAA